MSKKSKLCIAAVGDLHVHAHSDGFYHDLFAEISESADVLLLCGDLTNLGLPEEAEELAKSFGGCRIPALGVLGNHDYENGKADEIKKILKASKFIFLDEEPFELHGVGFAGVKGFGGGFGNHVLGSLGEPALKAYVAESVNESLRLENLLGMLTAPKKVAVLHYSPIPETLRGEPQEIFPFLGSSRLADVIDRFDVTAALHGHAHHGTHEGTTPKGTPVYNVSLELMRKKNPEAPYAFIEL